MDAYNHPKGKAFIDDIIAVYKKHGLVLNNEGAFIIEAYVPQGIAENWLKQTYVNHCGLRHYFPCDCEGMGGDR